MQSSLLHNIKKPKSELILLLGSFTEFWLLKNTIPKIKITKTTMHVTIVSFFHYKSFVFLKLLTNILTSLFQKLTPMFYHLGYNIVHNFQIYTKAKSQIYKNTKRELWKKTKALIQLAYCIFFIIKSYKSSNNKNP